MLSWNLSLISISRASRSSPLSTARKLMADGATKVGLWDVQASGENEAIEPFLSRSAY